MKRRVFLVLPLLPWLVRFQRKRRFLLAVKQMRAATKALKLAVARLKGEERS